MAGPICLSPLRFYDNLSKQNHRKSYAYGHISPLIMPFNTLDPFQFVLINNTDQIIDAYLIDAKTDERITGNILKQLEEAGFTHKNIGGLRLVTFPGIFPLLDIKYEGEYYLLLQSNIGYDYYSEVFCFTNTSDDCLTLEYWNPEADFLIKNGIISFADNFRFKIRLRTELGKPEYKFEEEATKRLGYSFIESQVSSKIYKFNAVIPEYLCDALRIVRLCSNKTIESKGETYDMITFDMDVDWQDQGDLASVNCEFQVDNILVNLGGYSAQPSGGDYNEDFNNDYIIS